MKTLILIIGLIAILLPKIVISQSNNTSLQFDGTDDYVNYGDPINGSLDFSVSESFSFFTWIKTTSVPSTYESIVHKRYNVSGNHYEGYILAVNSSGHIYFVVEGTDGNYSQMDGNINVTDGNWHCVVATRDVANDNINIYVDGVLDITMVDNTTSTLEGSMNFYIGRWDYYGRYFNGKIDEVSVWNYALNTTDIANYMDCPPIGNESNLISYWKFDEDTGTTAGESSTNNNNSGTLQNGPIWNIDKPLYDCQVSVVENDFLPLNIFPNPVINDITIDLPLNFNDDIQVVIMDVNGKLLMNSNLTSNSINVSNLSSGNYFIELTIGEQKYRQKFIKN